MRQEAAALWRATFGEPPRADLNSAQMIELALKAQPAATYSRLAASARARGLTWPVEPSATRSPHG